MTMPIPGQPHPDVAIVKNVLKEIKPGEVKSYSEVAKALGVSPDDPVFYRRCSAARKVLERPEEGGMVITPVPGRGFLRENGQQTKSRVAEKTTKSISRKANRGMRQLSTVDLSGMDQVGKAELWGVAAQLAAVRLVTSNPARLKLTAAAAATAAEMATQKVLQVLQERNDSKENS